jgi:amino acid transporter
VLSKIFIGVYGEIEFALAILTILLIVGIILMGLVIDPGGLSGQQRIGFRYWNNLGPFVQYLEILSAWCRFLGF